MKKKVIEGYVEPKPEFGILYFLDGKLRIGSIREQEDDYYPKKIRITIEEIKT